MSILSANQPGWSSPQKALSPGDLLLMDGLFELVDGELVEKYMSVIAAKTATRVIKLLSIFSDDHGLGEVLPEVTFKCFPRKPSQVRRPDVAFVSQSHSKDLPDEGHVLFRPDLAVEVVSPNDIVYELDEKLADYESAQIPLVWVVNPDLKMVRVIRPNQPTINLRATDQLSGEEILPGFSVRVAELFPSA